MLPHPVRGGEPGPRLTGNVTRACVSSCVAFCSAFHSSIVNDAPRRFVLFVPPTSLERVLRSFASVAVVSHNSSSLSSGFLTNFFDFGKFVSLLSEARNPVEIQYKGTEKPIQNLYGFFILCREFIVPRGATLTWQDLQHILRTKTPYLFMIRRYVHCRSPYSITHFTGYVKGRLSLLSTSTGRYTRFLLTAVFSHTNTHLSRGPFPDLLFLLLCALLYS